MSESIGTEMRISVRLRPGAVPRRVRVTVATAAEQAWALRAQRAFDRFVEGVDAASPDGARVVVTEAAVDAVPGQRLIVETWEASFPAIRPEDFGALAQEVTATVPGARALEIHERDGCAEENVSSSAESTCGG